MEGVQATNDDATHCKRLAVEKGYWRDPYISFFGSKPDKPRTPEINRGYFSRFLGIKLLIDKFIMATGGKCQIVNLGSGFDTLFWRLCDEGREFLSFVDVDLPNTTSRKLSYIKSKQQLLQKFKNIEGEIKFSKTDFHAHPYHIHAADITNVSDLERGLFSDCRIDPRIDTLFIAECVLVYIIPSQSQELLRWIADHFSNAFFINYEQVNMCDRFAEVMKDNLRSRNCELLGVESCLSKHSEEKRFIDAGFDGACCMEMTEVYSRLPPSEITRIESIEMLDDLEVFNQLLQHYAITWAYKESSPHGLSAIQLP